MIAARLDTLFLGSFTFHMTYRNALLIMASLAGLSFYKSIPFFPGRIETRNTTYRDTGKWVMFAGGNSWLTVKAKNNREKVTDQGWMNWENKKAFLVPMSGSTNPVPCNCVPC